MLRQAMVLFVSFLTIFGLGCGGSAPIEGVVPTAIGIDISICVEKITIYINEQVHTIGGYGNCTLPSAYNVMEIEVGSEIHIYLSRDGFEFEEKHILLDEDTYYDDMVSFPDSNGNLAANGFVFSWSDRDWCQLESGQETCL